MEMNCVLFCNKSLGGGAYICKLKARHLMTFFKIFLTSFAVSWTLDCVTSFFVSHQLQLNVNICVTVKGVSGVSSHNGGRIILKKYTK